MADLNWKELRAGNWVYSLGDVLIPEQVPDGRYLEQYAKIREPIPLNEEWLNKLGEFNKSNDNRWVYGNFNGFSIDNYNKEYWDFEIGGSSDHGRNEHIKIYYVHQLQNLYFFLTGNEL